MGRSLAGGLVLPEFFFLTFESFFVIIHANGENKSFLGDTFCILTAENLCRHFLSFEPIAKLSHHWKLRPCKIE